MTPSDSSVTSQPSRRSTSAMIWMSVIAGTFDSVVRPGASSAAAISFSDAVLRPADGDLAAQTAPPGTRITCTTGQSTDRGGPPPTI